MMTETFYNDSAQLEAIEDALRSAGHEGPTVLAAANSLIAERDALAHAEPRRQVDALAQFILDEVPGEPSQSQGAVDTAIRVIRELQAVAAQHAELVKDWAKDAGVPVPLTEGEPPTPPDADSRTDEGHPIWTGMDEV